MGQTDLSLTATQGYLPGFYIGVFLPDLIGRINQQFWCSVIVAVLYAIWAGVLHHANTGGLVTIFTLAQLFLNMGKHKLTSPATNLTQYGTGPNCTTFLLPVEVFPTRVRATAHGIAAASGKAGAMITAFAFGSLNDAIGLSAVLGILSGIMALCALCTLLIPETKGRTLEDIENDVLYGAKVHSVDSSSGDMSPVLDGVTNVQPKGDAKSKELEA